MQSYTKHYSMRKYLNWTEISKELLIFVEESKKQWKVLSVIVSIPNPLFKNIQFNLADFQRRKNASILQIIPKK